MICLTVVYRNDQIPGLFQHFLNARAILFAGWHNKQDVHSNWQSYTRMNWGTICVEVDPFRIHLFRKINCGLIPLPTQNILIFSVRERIHVYTKPKSQRNRGYFCKLCTFHACIHQRVVKNILPGYLSIAWNTSFNRKSLEHVYEETTNSIEVGCL